MMRVKRFECNMLQENCYVVNDEGGKCAIIDCGAFTQEEQNAIVGYIRKEGLEPTHLLSTHGHLDHNFGNQAMLTHFGLKTEIAAADKRMLENAGRQAQRFYGFDLPYTLPEAGNVLQDGDKIAVGSLTFEVIEVPGHSLGSVCFYDKAEGVLFSDDTLFKYSIGRTDLEGGSMMRIIQSLRRLAQLPDATKVYPGHGPATTIGDELAHNPFMDR